MAMGVPSVFPWKTPDRMRQRSDSFLGVTMSLWPGLRRSRSFWMSASSRSRSGGQPSTTTPTPPPWDSPQVAILKSCPNWLDTGLPLFRRVGIAAIAAFVRAGRLQLHLGLQPMHQGAPFRISLGHPYKVGAHRDLLLVRL